MKYQPSKKNKYIIRAIINDVVVAIYGKADHMVDAEIITPTDLNQPIEDHWVVIFRDGELSTFSTSDECQDWIEIFHYSVKGYRV